VLVPKNGALVKKTDPEEQWGSIVPSGGLISAQLRYEPQTRKYSAPAFIPGNTHAERICDNTAELFFTNQPRKSMYPVTECPDPFAPEEHTLDIIVPVWLYMAHHKLFKHLKLPELLIADVNVAEVELFTILFQHLKGCLIHEVCKKTGAHGLTEWFRLGHIGNTGSLTLRG